MLVFVSVIFLYPLAEAFRKRLIFHPVYAIIGIYPIEKEFVP